MALKQLPPRHVLITGAGSGIGAALARFYAAPGIKLSLLGRNVGRLNDTAEICRKHGAEVTVQAADVTDATALTNWLIASDESCPIDLLIANAGIGGDQVMAGSAGENLSTASRIIATNLEGVINTIVPLLPRLIAR